MGNGTEQDHLMDVEIPGYEEKINLLEQDKISLLFHRNWVNGKIHSTGVAMLNLQKERDELREVQKKIQEATDILDEPKNEQG